MTHNGVPHSELHADASHSAGVDCKVVNRINRKMFRHDRQGDPDCDTEVTGVNGQMDRSGQTAHPGLSHLLLLWMNAW